jgi:plastocyanin
MHAPSRSYLSSATLILATLLLSLSTVSAQDAEATDRKPYVKTGQEATITGSIDFKGEPPPFKLISMDADLACMKINPRPKLRQVMITGGKLANAFVYVKSAKGALAGHTFEMPTTEAILEHKRCEYSPHVLGIRSGQWLRIVNDDPTSHNTRASPKINKEWNISQLQGGEPVVKTFELAEQFIPFRCNQHPWEKAWVGVFDHPFFAVTGKDGSFKIEGLPPGDYTIVVWHEWLGEKEFEVTLVPYQWKVLDFGFASKAQP